MTVSTTENRIPYDGDGVSTVFNFPYKFLATTDLQVYVNGVLQTLTTHYSVGTPSDGGANVTFVTAPPVGDANVVILRDVDTLQESELPSNGPFPSSTVEQMVDKITLQVQRLRDLVSRAITLSDADSSTASTTLPSPEAGTLLGWNDALTGLQNVDPADLLTVAGSSGFSYQTFSGTGAQLNFTLNENPGAIANLSVFVSGVRQTPVTDYTVAGTTLTFIVAPALGTNNILAVWGTTLGIGVPSDTSVTLSKMPDGVFAATSAALAKFADGFLSATAGARAKMADGFVTLSKLASDIFSGATTVTIASGDKLVLADVSDGGNTKVALVSDIVALATPYATNAEYVTGTETAKVLSPSVARARNVVQGTAVASTSGTSIDFTGIPSWVKRIVILFNGVSYNAAAQPMFQIGTSGGMETTGYLSAGGDYVPTANHNSSTAGFIIGGGTSLGTSTNLMHGRIVLENVSGNIWIMSGVLATTGTPSTGTGSGNKTLAGTLDRVRITSVAGTATFDAGSVNILYE